MGKITYSIIGGGWRAEFYLRIAKLVPEKFSVACILVRNKETAKLISEKYDVKIVNALKELKETPVDFIVNCINKDDITALSFALAEEGFPVLMETPACVDKEQIKNYKSSYKIQVAEQFHLKPMYQAIKSIISAGTIGNVNYVYASVAHQYHGMSLIRYFLDADNAPRKITDCSFNCPILHTNFRSGEISNKEYQNSIHTVKIFDFSGKTAVYDYENEQYFSPIRTDRLLIRGDRGEIENGVVRYFNSNNEFVQSEIIQHKSGNLDGFYNGSITFENKVLYKSPFGCARLSDEETAMATVLVKMKEYTETGKEFYNFEHAAEDVTYFD